MSGASAAAWATPGLDQGLLDDFHRLLRRFDLRILPRRVLGQVELLGDDRQQAGQSAAVLENRRVHVARELLGLGHGAQGMTLHVIVPGQPAVARQLGTRVGRGRRIELVSGIALEAEQIVLDAARANRIADFLLKDLDHARGQRLAYGFTGCFFGRRLGGLLRIDFAAHGCRLFRCRLAIRYFFSLLYHHTKLDGGRDALSGLDCVRFHGLFIRHLNVGCVARGRRQIAGNGNLTPENKQSQGEKKRADIPRGPSRHHNASPTELACESRILKLLSYVVNRASPNLLPRIAVT